MKIRTTLISSLAVALLVVSGTSQAVSCWKGVCHVQRGDTLYKIAKANDMSVQTLMSANGLKSSARLRVGQVIHLVGAGSNEPMPATKGDTIYDTGSGTGSADTGSVDNGGKANNVAIVTMDDTLFSIAKETGTSVEYLKQLNGLTSNTIYLGQHLLIRE